METLQRERVTDQSADSTFDPASFYSMLRAEGGNPVVRDGALYMALDGAVTDAGRWAALHDPAGEARLKYARSIWAERHPRAETVELG